MRYAPVLKYENCTLYTWFWQATTHIYTRTATNKGYMWSLKCSWIEGTDEAIDLDSTTMLDSATTLSVMIAP